VICGTGDQPVIPTEVSSPRVMYKNRTAKIQGLLGFLILYCDSSFVSQHMWLHNWNSLSGKGLDTCDSYHLLEVLQLVLCLTKPIIMPMILRNLLEGLEIRH
jgi:hypothetical protein